MDLYRPRPGQFDPEDMRWRAEREMAYYSRGYTMPAAQAAAGFDMAAFPRSLKNPQRRYDELRSPSGGNYSHEVAEDMVDRWIDMGIRTVTARNVPLLATPSSRQEVWVPKSCRVSSRPKP